MCVCVRACVCARVCVCVSVWWREGGNVLSFLHLGKGAANSDRPARERESSVSSVLRHFGEKAIRPSEGIFRGQNGINRVTYKDVVCFLLGNSPAS
jgi:hypothetical protein